MDKACLVKLKCEEIERQWIKKSRHGFKEDQEHKQQHFYSLLLPQVCKNKTCQMICDLKVKTFAHLSIALLLGMLIPLKCVKQGSLYFVLTSLSWANTAPGDQRLLLCGEKSCAGRK